MRKVLLLILILPASFIGYGQSEPVKPPKGVKHAICEYTKGADSLFHGLSKSLLTAGYTIDKRDKELFLITTEGKELRHVNYKIRVVINGNKADVSSKWMTNVTLSLGGAKLEQTWYDTEMANSKGNVQNAIWKELMAFIESTKPNNITFEK